jgi:hypothetical protein
MIWGVAVILCACFAMVATPVKAATTYDGTYDITLSGNVYNFATDSVEFTTDTAPDFLIISNGRISDAGFDGTYKNFPASKQVPPPSPPAPVGGSIWLSWTGSVDSSGSTNWHGGCFIAGLNTDYTFIGAIRSDGSGSGTWSAVDQAYGTWTVQKSGGSLGGIGSSASVPIAGLTVAAAAIGLGASLLPAPPGASPPPQGYGQTAAFQPSPTHHTSPRWDQGAHTHQTPSYQQGSVISETNSYAGGPPAGGESLGGAGLTIPTLFDQYGNPVLPRDWSAQSPPSCPRHPWVSCQANYAINFAHGSPGSWYCRECDRENNPHWIDGIQSKDPRYGFPWGTNHL